MKNKLKSINWFHVVCVMMALVVVCSLGISAKAAKLTLTGDLANYFTATYESTNGAPTQNGMEITISAKANNNIGEIKELVDGCNKTPAGYRRATTIRLKALADCVVDYNVTSGEAECTHAKGSVVLKGTEIAFTVESPNTAKDATASATIEITVTQQAHSAPDNCASYYVKGTPAITYYYLDEAVTAAKDASEKVIVLKTSGNVCLSTNAKKVEIPAGVTLLLPRDRDELDIGSSTVTNQTATAAVQLENANFSAWAWDSRYKINPSSNRYLMLTIPSGITVENKGSIILGGSIGANIAYFNGGTLAQEETLNHRHSDLTVNGTLELHSNSVLSAIGFVLGSGTVKTVGTGAKIYQPFVVNDFRGGNYTGGAAGGLNPAGASLSPGTKSGETAISPFVRYSFVNIRSTLIIGGGNYMYGYCDLWASDQHNMTVGMIIGGEDDDALIKLPVGSSLTSTYNPDVYVEHKDSQGGYGDKNAVDWGYQWIGKATLIISGDATMGSMTLSVPFGEDMIPVSMSGVTFPIPYNFDITLTNGDFSIPYSLMLLPGAKLTVGTGAVLNIGDGENDIRFMVMDGLYDHTWCGYDYGSYSATYGGQYDYNYPTSAELMAAKSEAYSGTACLVVDGGSLNINPGVSFGGLVQTTGASGSTVTFNGDVDDDKIGRCTTQVGLVGSKSYRWVGATVRTLEAKIKVGDNSDVNMTVGATYKGAKDENNNITSYTYKLYTKTDGTNETHTEENLDFKVYGMWYDYTLTVKEEGKEDVVYYHLGGKLYTANGEVTEHIYEANYDPEIEGQAGYVTVDKANKKLTFTGALEKDTVVTIAPPPVAEVHSGETVTGFGTLQGAVDAAVKAGDKVVLLVDLIEEKALDAAITVAEGQDITIDLNGHSVTASQFINIPAGATVDITSSAETDGSITKGTITGTLVSSNTNNEVASPGSTPGVIINRGNLTVSNVSIIQKTGTSCAGIFNFAAGVIDSIENVVIDVGSAELSYGIVTYGKIDIIASTNITAHRGICVYDNANAQITTIGPAKKPVTITAVQYGIHVQAAKNVAKQSRIETVGEVEITTNRDSGTTELTGDAEHLKVNAAIYLYSGLGIGNIGIDGGTTTLNGEVGIYASRAPVGIIGVEDSTVNIDARLAGIFGYGAKSIFGTIGVSGSQVKIDSEANGIHVYYGGSVATIGEKLGTDVKAEATVVINAANYGINVHAPNANSTTSIDVIGSVKVTNSVRGISVYGGGTETRIAQINTIGMQGCDTIIEGDYGIYVIHTGSKINTIGAAGGNVTIKGNEDIAFRIGKGAVGAIGATGGKVTIQSKDDDAIYISDGATIGTIGVANAANTCVEIIGAKRAILNGSGCTISKITDGLLAVTTANNRCLQNNGTIKELSGGCFSSAKGTASYAVYNSTSVEGASITYPDGMGLSSYTVPVKTSSGETYECYYITTKAMDGKVILDAISLDIESEIQFNLKFLIPSNIRAEGGQITVTEEKNAIEPEKTQTVNFANLTTTDHQGRLVFTQGIAAGEMTGNVTVTILNAKDEPIAIYDTEGVEISQNGTLVRTVQDYAKLAFGSDKTELKDMCAAMLIFGEHAQKFYGTHTDRLASSILTEYLIDAPDISQIDVAALPEVEHSGYDIGIKVSSQQVDLDSDVKLRVFFTRTDAEAWDDYTIKLTRPAGNGTTEATQTWELEIGERVGAESTESYYYVEFAVPPAYWNNNYVITVTPEVLPEGETVEQNTYTVTTSVMAWVKDCIETNTNDNEVNMAKAMYYYSDLADAYFAAKAAVNQ